MHTLLYDHNNMRDTKSKNFFKNVQKIRKLRYEKNYKTREKLKVFQHKIFRDNIISSSNSFYISNNISFDFQDDNFDINDVDVDKLFNE